MQELLLQPQEDNNMKTIRIDKVSWNLDWVGKFRSKQSFVKHPSMEGVSTETIDLLWDMTHPKKEDEKKEEGV